MKTYTEDEMDTMMNNIDLPTASTIDEDLKGQIVIYTNVFRWNDGSFRDTPDPDFE